MTNMVIFFVSVALLQSKITVKTTKTVISKLNKIQIDKTIVFKNQ